jgi:hypothetical protein
MFSDHKILCSSPDDLKIPPHPSRGIPCQPMSFGGEGKGKRKWGTMLKKKEERGRNRKKGKEKEKTGSKKGQINAK